MSLGKYVMTGVCHYCVTQKRFTARKRFWALAIHPSLPLNSWPITDPFVVSIALPFPEGHVVATVQCSFFRLAFFIW